MKNNDIKIDSLKAIQRRKLQIKRELVICEEVMQESLYNVTHPLNFLRKEACEARYEYERSPVETVGNFGRKLAKVLSIAGTAVTAYKTFKKFRGK